MRFILTSGASAEYNQALALLEGFEPRAVIADKGYDANFIIEAIERMEAEAVIPPRRHRITPRSYDRHLYKERNLIERMFNKIKHFRRVSTRYDKTSSSFLAFLHLAGIYLWLK